MRTQAWGIGLACCVCWVAGLGLAGEAKEVAPPDAGGKPGAPLAAQPVPENAPDAAADAKLHEILKTKQVSFNFVDTPLSDALSFLKATLGVNVVVDGKMDTKQRVTVQATNMNAEAAIQWVLRVAGAQMVVKHGNIVVRPVAAEEGPAKVKPEGAADDEATRKIAEGLKKKVSFDFVETPFVDAISFIQALVNVNILVAPDVKKTQPLTLRVTDMPVGQALQWMAKLVGAKMEIKDGVVFISADRADAKVKPEGGHDPRVQRMVGKAQVNLGPNASVELYLYEDDIPPNLRQALLNALHKALAAELRKAGQGEEGAAKK